MAGMLSHLVTAGSHLPILLLHADLDEASWALKGQVFADLQALPNATCHVWYEAGTESTLPVAGVHSGLMNLDDVELPDSALFYLCGPLPFMTAVRAALLERGVPARDIQYEVFGPDLWQADAETEPVHGDR
jgi:nitric oxide dioxygenase